ncbi:MAG: hypothetical protein V1929_00640 [bacterium]
MLSILALAATACFLLLITFQVMEMNTYGSASAPTPASAAETSAITAP